MSCDTNAIDELLEQLEQFMGTQSTASPAAALSILVGRALGAVGLGVAVDQALGLNTDARLQPELQQSVEQLTRTRTEEEEEEDERRQRCTVEEGNVGRGSRMVERVVELVNQNESQFEESVNDKLGFNPVGGFDFNPFDEPGSIIPGRGQLVQALTRLWTETAESLTECYEQLIDEATFPRTEPCQNRRSELRNKEVCLEYADDADQR